MSTTANSPIPVLLSRRSFDLIEELGLPESGDNLFQRIIRNPHAETAISRERECTEMLCAVLRNSTVLRNLLLRWMANLVGDHIRGLEDLHFTIDTEGAVGSKRDDLRIEGWREYEDNKKLVLIWTVEVKVGAPFHDSSPLGGVADDEGNGDLVNQVINYDHWLDGQPVRHRAGFVLALYDMTECLPAGLSCRWECFSWTALGREIRDVLERVQLPEKEGFLARHLLGFINEHLWRTSEMSEVELGFDDLAIIRAFQQYGRDSEEKVNRLVTPLQSLILNSGIGVGDPVHQKVLFKSLRRSVIWRNVFTNEFCAYPTLMAGVSGAKLSIWLETAPRHERKSDIRSVIQELLPHLKARNPNWRVNEESGEWWDLSLEAPLTRLLATTHQAGEFAMFFNHALEDLKEVGVINKLRERVAK